MSVPLRAVVPGFAVTEYVTVPFPVPLALPVIVTQDTLLVAIQLHVLVGVVTLTAPVLDPVTTTAPVADSVYVHAAATTCVTVNVCPAIVIVPVRVEPLVFAATE